MAKLVADPRDVTGVWYGSWTSYTALIEPNRFIAQLEELGGAVGGTTSEPGAEGELRATIQGERNGARIEWTKRYDGSGGVNDAIRYSGRVNGEGTEIRGIWQQLLGSGTFTMQREHFSIAELADVEDRAVVEGR